MRRFAFALLLGLVWPGSAARAQVPVDLELVLAIDGSTSINEQEYALQMQGFAAAFRDEEVLAAIQEGPLGRIAVATLLWADAAAPRQPGPWFLISNRAEAEAFARSLERTGRGVTGGTGIGAGIADAILMFQRNGYLGLRQVVDVSGDGVETPPKEVAVVELPQARAMATALGVTINGLSIINEMTFLDRWYQKHVITGSNCFVMIAANYRDFRQAIRRKLLREIRERPNMALRPPFVEPARYGVSGR